MPWGKTKCLEIAGWEQRITSKVIYSAATGAIVGATLSTLNSTPLLKGTATSTASFVLLMGFFATVQETTRLVRCEDSPVNSGLAGWATGGLLFKAHGRPPFQGAAAVSLIGATTHWLSDQLGPDTGMKGILKAVGLLDDPGNREEFFLRGEEREGQKGLTTTTTAAAGGGGVGGRAASVASNEKFEPNALFRLWTRLERYSPIRKMTDEEWEAHEAKKEKALQARLADIKPK